MYLFIKLQLSRPWQGVFRVQACREPRGEGARWVHAFHKDVEDRGGSKDVFAVGDVPALSFLPEPLQ